VQNIKSLKVALENRSYDILIGENLIADAARHIMPVLQQKRIIIITDKNVAGLHLQALEKSLGEAEIKTESIIIPAGEQSKSFSSLEKLTEEILEKNIDRKTVLLALGGGVIGDLTGFAASILLRGIDFIQVPTTLLAMVDSSVGGKTGINSKSGKNMVGSFHQPRLVLSDISALKTLDKRQFLAGFAEVIKYGLIADRHFFEWLKRNLTKIKEREPEALTHAIFKSCAAKADIVSRDEKEQDVRALLNLGHTFGHALELVTGFSDKLLHGEGVAIGMALAFKFSAAIGLCSDAASMEVEDFLRESGLPHSLKLIKNNNVPVLAKSMIVAMHKDKKADGGKLTFILPRAIGDCFMDKNVDERKLLNFLNTELEKA